MGKRRRRRRPALTSGEIAELAGHLVDTGYRAAAREIARRGPLVPTPPLFTGSDLRFGGVPLHPVPGSVLRVDVGDVAWTSVVRIDNRPTDAR